MHAREMIGTHPAVQGQISDALIRCIEECYSCAQTCTSCADACLSERMVQELTQCIRLDLDCADICNITGRILTRRTGSDDEVMRRMLSVCAAACRLCAEECQRHAAELSPNFGDGRSRSGGGGCGLTVDRLGDDLDPVVECHTENEFWQLVVAIETT